MYYYSQLSSFETQSTPTRLHTTVFSMSHPLQLYTDQHRKNVAFKPSAQSESSRRPLHRKHPEITKEVRLLQGLKKYLHPVTFSIVATQVRFFEGRRVIDKSINEKSLGLALMPTSPKVCRMRRKRIICHR